ncbi:hypothetical protein SAMN05660666_02482 [Novosphingobium aromaticivorans]|nr:hypothetical protein [Novosphingobium aromaticivorans]SCY68911.1 hypothetical protein SAMN05660666_02482 [Novosphingobium aromaticivorans]
MADDLVGGIVCNGCWETCAHAPGIGYYCRNEGCTYEYNRAKAMLWHMRPVEPRDARIEALEAALAEARRTALTECLRIAKAAQYSKAPATDTMRGIQKLIEDSPTPPPVV